MWVEAAGWLGRLWGGMDSLPVLAERALRFESPTWPPL